MKYFILTAIGVAITVVIIAFSVKVITEIFKK